MHLVQKKCHVCKDLCTNSECRGSEREKVLPISRNSQETIIKFIVTCACFRSQDMTEKNIIYDCQYNIELLSIKMFQIIKVGSINY